MVGALGALMHAKNFRRRKVRPWSVIARAGDFIESAMQIKAANDSRPVFERLKDFAERGTDAPETLNLSEVRQVSFALSLYLTLDTEN